MVFLFVRAEVLEANSKFNFRPHRLVSGFGCGKHYHKHFKTVTLGYSATAVYLNFKHALGITFHLFAVDFYGISGSAVGIQQQRSGRTCGNLNRSRRFYLQASGINHTVISNGTVFRIAAGISCYSNNAALIRITGFFIAKADYRCLAGKLL